MTRLQNYALGEWVEGTGNFTELFHAVTGEHVAEASSAGLDFKAMAQYARTVGGPALRRMTFHQRARMLKALAVHLTERKPEFYTVSEATGATKGDHWIDIDGGIGTLFAYASRGRREFPDEPFFIDGPTEALSKGGTFVGRHVCVPLEGVAVHINAFNFPVWGMLEKLAGNRVALEPLAPQANTPLDFRIVILRADAIDPAMPEQPTWSPTGWSTSVSWHGNATVVKASCWWASPGIADPWSPPTPGAPPCG